MGRSPFSFLLGYLKSTRSVACQPLRVFFISSVIHSGSNHIAHLRVKGRAAASVGEAYAPDRAAGSALLL